MLRGTEIVEVVLNGHGIEDKLICNITSIKELTHADDGRVVMIETLTWTMRSRVTMRSVSVCKI